MAKEKPQRKSERLAMTTQRKSERLAKSQPPSRTAKTSSRLLPSLPSPATEPPPPPAAAVARAPRSRRCHPSLSNSQPPRLLPSSPSPSPANEPLPPPAAAVARAPESPCRHPSLSNSQPPRLLPLSHWPATEPLPPPAPAVVRAPDSPRRNPSLSNGGMSHVADTSNLTASDNVMPEPGSTSRSRVATGSSVVGGSSMKKLKFNDHGLPVGGEDWAKSSSRLGHLTRTHVPICYISWKMVPTRYKVQLWIAYKGEFPDVRESQKEIFMKKANNAWKKLKGKLRANLVGDDVTKWKEQVPVNTTSEDWEQFCNNEATESQKDLRKRNKAIKKSCPIKTTHNTGRDGYARRAEKWKAEHGHYPNRAELWLYTHKQKDGSYAPHDREFADKVEMLLKLFQERGDKETLDSGPIFDTFGKETRGRVRCVGSTISRKAMMASAFAREMLQEVHSDHNDWREKVDSLKEEMELLKSTVIEFVKDFKSGKVIRGDHDIHTTATAGTLTSATLTSTPQFSSPNELVPCKILSYSGEICGYGRKTQLNVVPSVHGHCLKPREVRIILDNIKVHDCPLWGGKQASCSTLGDVGIGGFLYWHDDLLPPHDDTGQE